MLWRHKYDDYDDDVDDDDVDDDDDNNNNNNNKLNFNLHVFRVFIYLYFIWLNFKWQLKFCDVKEGGLIGRNVKGSDRDLVWELQWHYRAGTEDSTANISVDRWSSGRDLNSGLSNTKLERYPFSVKFVTKHIKKISVPRQNLVISTQTRMSRTSLCNYLQQIANDLRWSKHVRD
jgi:hypothetical protein